ncbi:hypothetical protein BGZ72_006334 [Mortierella alpina]|nr:hypothetical protein BGZ72_006334 [Mortierella alpina]
MFAKPIETKPASPPGTTTTGSGFAGLKPTPTVGKLAGFNPTSTSAPRTTPPVAKGAMSAIAQAKAALFERAQQSNSSPTTPVMAPNRASISSISSITSVGSARDPSSPTTPVSASPFRKSSVSSISNNFRDNGNSQVPSPTTPVSASPFRKPSISNMNGFKDPTSASQASSPNTSSTPVSLRNGMNTTWDPTSVQQAPSTTTPFTPKSLRKASISGLNHFKEPATVPQAVTLPTTSPVVTATIRKLSISNSSGDQVREMVSGFKTHSRTPSVDAGQFKTRSRAPSVSVDVSAFQPRSRAASISVDMSEIKVRSRSASIQLNNTSVQAPLLPSVESVAESQPTVPDPEIQVAALDVAAVDTPAEMTVPDDVRTAVTIKPMDKLVAAESLPPVKVPVPAEVLAPVEVSAPSEEPAPVELPAAIESSAPIETSIPVESAAPITLTSALDAKVDAAVFIPETPSPTALPPADADVAECESIVPSQPEAVPRVVAEPVAAIKDILVPAVVENLMEAEIISLIIPSKTKEEMLQSAPEEPVVSPVSSHASSHHRRSGVLPQKFHWKHGGEVVKVTGTFDDWKETVHLRKVPSTRDEFAAIVDLDRTKHIQFKFVVDGVWRCSTEFATEYDCSGNVNNVLPALSLEQCASPHHHH